MRRYVIVEKAVGETPLEATERYRVRANIDTGTPLAYAGRLDPMASGQLLILIGDECKRQTYYHNLDKAYTFSVLLGVGSDTGDVLGILHYQDTVPDVTERRLQAVAEKYSSSTIELPYPQYSSKPVDGKPLHTWAVEGKIAEIEIPTKVSYIYRLTLQSAEVVSKEVIYQTARTKIETIPPVTDERKALGNDFRRPDVRAAWDTWQTAKTPEQYTIATFTCICSSGTYMRSLSEEIGRQLETEALAYTIHRTAIGRYQPFPFNLGFWRQTY